MAMSPDHFVVPSVRDSTISPNISNKHTSISKLEHLIEDILPRLPLFGSDVWHQEAAQQFFQILAQVSRYRSKGSKSSVISKRERQLRGYATD